MFVNVTMLAGIAGALLPLVLHLLNRARYRRVRWGAMMFLEDDREARHHASTRIKELTLLLLRMAIVALLAIALARPVIGTAASGAPAIGVENHSATVILLDRSGSMGLDDNGRLRIDPARRAVISALASLRRGDEAALVIMPGNATEPPQLTTDLQSLATRASATRPFWGRADIASGLGSAAKLLGSSHASDKRVLLVCDRQASNWRDVNETFARNWRESVRDSSNGGQLPRFIVVPVGGNEPANVAIEAVQPASTPVIRDVPTEIEVRVTNFDTIARPNISLTLGPSVAAGSTQPTADPSWGYRATVNLDAGASIVCRCPVRFPVSGQQVIKASITPQDLSGDDTLDCAMDVIDPIEVLVISGDQVRKGSGAQFIRMALEPFASSGQSGPDPARVRVVGAEQWPQFDRATERVVILDNVARISPPQVRQLEQFVYGGGGLLIAPGSLSQVVDYNALLWRDGSGVMPAELGSPAGVSDASSATTLLGLDLTHEMFQFLRGREDPMPGGVTISRHFPMGGIGPPAGHVLGRYSSGDPFLVEATFGHGRVLLMTTALDADWSTLPRSSFYLPFLQSAVRYLSSGAVPTDRNVWAGEPIVASIDDATDIQATIEGPPGNSRFPVKLARAGGGYEARFANTNRPGTYKLKVQTSTGPRVLVFAVRPTRDESDVSSLSEQRWLQLRAMLGFEPIEDEEGMGESHRLASALSEFSRGGREIWPLMLCGVIALALVELGLARLWTMSEGVSA